MIPGERNPGVFTHRTIQSFSLLVLLTACLLSGCDNSQPTPAASPDSSIAVTNRQDRIELVITVSPSSVELTQDHVLDISVTHPSEMDVSLPLMDDRLQGFRSNQMMDDEPVSANGSTRLRRRFLLTPTLADEYRIAPAPVTYVDRSHTPPRNGWFPTPPLVLTPPSHSAGTQTDPAWQMRPRWIRPTTKEIAIHSLIILAILLGIWGLWKASKQLRRQIRMMVMSPRERALFELQELLAGDWIVRGEYKEFYLRLTRIVRQFIERRHGIRAPEQTTEEFLAAIASDARFPLPVASKLRAFLNASDLVKFAAHTPDSASISDVTTTAREYIESDKPESGDPKRRKD